MTYISKSIYISKSHLYIQVVGYISVHHYAWANYESSSLLNLRIFLEVHRDYFYRFLQVFGVFPNIP